MAGLALTTTKRRTRQISPAQSQVQQTISGLSRMYRALPMASKGLWQLAANQINSTLGRTGRSKMTAANAFSTINSARLAAQMEILTEPVLPVTGPPVFPNLTLQATHSGGKFTLTLNAQGPVADIIVIQSAPPVVAGRTSYSTSSFRPVGAIDGINGFADITNLFTAKYGTPEAGSAIAVRIYAVSEAGLRSGALIVTTVYLASSAAGTLGDDSDLPIAA